MTSVAFRYLTAEDLAFADSLRAQAGWNQTLADWKRFLELSPNGCILAESEGRPVATATTIRFGTELGWIGMVLVHHDYRRRGIGRLLVKHAIEILRNQNVGAIKLDATPAGREVYLQLGFKDEFTLTRFAGGPFDAALPLGLAQVSAADLPAIAELDSAAIGARRDSLLASLLKDSPRALRSESGFGFLRVGSLATYMGPVVGADTALADALIAGQRRIFCDIPNHNKVAVAWSKSRGFVPQRSLTRMCLGPNIQPGSPESLFAIAAPELG